MSSWEGNINSGGLYISTNVAELGLEVVIELIHLQNVILLYLLQSFLSLFAEQFGLLCCFNLKSKVIQNLLLGTESILVRK